MDLYRVISAIIIIAIFVFIFITKYPNPSQRLPVMPLKSNNIPLRSQSQPPATNQDHLNKFFKPATKKVATDYPTKQIGECPYSKPMSTDTPIGNIPMYFAENSANMRLI
jgi:hypothetical protein